MKRESIIEYAAQNIKPDGNLNCAEWVLFYTARDIYKAYYNGSITIQAGEERKKRALRQFELDNGELLRAKEVLRQHAEMWKFIKFSLTGASTTVLDYAVFALLQFVVFRSLNETSVTDNAVLAFLGIHFPSVHMIAQSFSPFVRYSPATTKTDVFP